MGFKARRRWLWQIVSVREKRHSGGVILWLFPTEATPPRWANPFGCLSVELSNEQSVLSAGMMGYVQSTVATRYANRLVTVVESYFPAKYPVPMRGQFLRPTVEMHKLIPKFRALWAARHSIETALQRKDLDPSQIARLEMRLAQLTDQITVVDQRLKNRDEAAGGRVYPYPNLEKPPQSQIGLK